MQFLSERNITYQRRRRGGELDRHRKLVEILARIEQRLATIEQRQR